MMHKTSDAKQRIEPARPLGRLFAPVDATGLAAFRVWFAAIMLWEMARFWQYGWLESDYLSLTFYFTYYGFDWVRSWPGPGMHVQLAVMTIAAAGVLLGLCYRLCALAFFLGYTHLFLIETTYYQNHCYLICLLSLLLVFIPAHREFSIDAWRRKRKADRTGAPPSNAGVPAWSVWLLRFQIGVPYFYGGLAKLESDWLHGAQSRMMLLRSAADWPGWEGLLTHDLAVFVFAWGGLLFDLLIVPALIGRRTRLAAYLLAVAFHLTNATLLEIGVFPWLMIGATLIFFEPDWPLRFRHWRSRRSAVGSRSSQARGKQPVRKSATDCTPRFEELRTSRRQRMTICLIGLYVLWQIIFPLRHLLYPGNPSWTEDAHRFSWRMKLGFKTAMLPRFYATDPKTGETHPLAYERNVSLRQLELMAGHPDMLLQFSRFLADELEEMDYGRMEIRVVTAVSLNGRRPQMLIDPNIDLAAQPRTMNPKPWILPLTEPLRDQPWDWGMDPIESP
jgi:vitamin K-dependent gamma-carboxylase